MRKLRFSRRKIIIPGFILVGLMGLWMLAGQHNSTDEWGNEPYISLYLHQQDRVVKVRFEEYLVGVVAAEMPASFEIEALKAQAVCARTYALKKMLGAHEYPRQADLSDDINYCQAYLSPADFAGRNPAQQKKIKKAVAETRGEIMLCRGEIIDALYHSTCGGKTENAGDAWQNDLPYLNSVVCEYCARSKYYATVQVFSSRELQNELQVKLTEDLQVKVTKTTATGRVKELLINNVKFSGEEFRCRLNLPSNWWDLKINKDELIIKSSGYGHGVGMCQYGANGMAEEGADYKKILRHYFGDIQFNKISYDVLD